ncbi:uncharacterized protein BDZ99DRAFT_571945 [Mytilinidion resinicola]|uniref:F-box domain-containing protein n=1 Tax=Mytilinidion resinicola TaxID=574789 RepID=A0A6A6YKQ1_9PEZI|nr:uncharacterized protein BDZ99DRAFT_571945 [Mytilinidion resinicola]KAF2809133.1 hypothetical protein BDZ99DRAFT_571945 [Mytilinidion resinicola]
MSGQYSIAHAANGDQTLIVCGGLKDFKDTAENILKDDYRIARLRAIEISRNENEDDEAIAKKEERPEEDVRAELATFSQSMADILNAIHEKGKLESFKWSGLQFAIKKTARSTAFWEALWKHSATLTKLELDCDQREIGNIPHPTAPMPNLHTLNLWMGNACGDDGTIVNKLLHGAPSITALVLSLPGCDLDGCRIRNLTWDYTFPQLSTLLLSVFNVPLTPVFDFLLRHPLVKTLTYGVDTYRDESPDVFPNAALPALRAIKFETCFDDDAVQEIFSADAARPIAHVSIQSSSQRLFPHLAAISPSLKCLEIEARCSEWRPEEPDSDSSDSEEEEEEEKKKIEPSPRLPEVVKALLPSLTALRELAIDLDTDTRIYSNGNWKQQPPPMSADDLISVLEVLPAKSDIRVVRLSDSRGEELSEAFRGDVPGVPESLEFIRWDIGKKRILYRLEREGGKVKAVWHERLWHSTGGEKAWTDERVLEY